VPNIQINGYDYISQRVLTADEQIANPEKSKAAILNYAFNSPIVIKDYRQFMSLANMFKAVVFVVYVDPNDSDSTQAVLEAMCRARL